MKFVFSFLLIIISFSCQNKPSFREGLSITTLNGDKVELSEYSDKVIFLNLWATWCAHCIKEMPSIEAVSKKFGDEVEFILASNEDMEKIIQFKTKKPFDLNYVFMNSSPESMGVYALPATFIINKKGEIAFEEKGSRDWDSEESINLINKIINE